MEMLQNYIDALWVMTCEMAPYLLLGFFFAGLLHSFVPQYIYNSHLSKNNFSSVLKASLFGIPLPLCSCGVIPTAVSLRKNGASKGATTAFLISTPQTGVDSILATYSLMGLPFAIIRPITAFLTSLLGGWIVSATDKEKESIVCACDNSEQKKSFVQKVVEALHYGFVLMLQDVGRWLVLGLFIAALITVLMPKDWLVGLAAYPILNMLVVLSISIPMYICATGSIPIAMSLMLKGLTPGAALVLLMAGPATNVASILMVGKTLGRKVLIKYLLALIIGAVCMGLIIDYLLPTQWFAVANMSSEIYCHAHTIGLFSKLCSIALLLLLLYAFILKYFKRENSINQKDMIVVKVKGMMCNHCKANVEKNLLALDGVTSVEVSLEKGEAKVEGNVSESLIKETIKNIGYEVE